MKEEQLIEKLYKTGKLYIIENNREGCYQLALKTKKKPDPENDPIWELDVEWLD